MWEKLRELHKEANGERADFDPDLYGDLQNENLLDNRIKSKEDFNIFMRLLYVIRILIELYLNLKQPL